MAAIPVREGARALSVGLPAPTLTRHSWRGRGRAWIEVRGLDGPDGAELGRFVVDAVRARPGVKSVSVNRPLSRIVVGLSNDQISVRDLCRDVDEAEKRWRASGSVDHDAMTLARNHCRAMACCSPPTRWGSARPRSASALQSWAGCCDGRICSTASRRWWWPSTISLGCAGCSRTTSATRPPTRCCRCRWWWHTSSNFHRRRWPSTSRWKS